ncbi:MAG: Gfo/Idh/MocA family oxidoreductase [bacterium]
MDTIRVGIIGAGYIAQHHLEAIKSIGSIEVVGITSRTRKKAEQLAEQFNILHCSDNVGELIAQTKLDALMVLVSVDQMYSVVSSLLSLGLPLFIEKPAGLNKKENDDLVTLAQTHNIQTMVGLNRRYYSIFHKGIDLIRKHGKLFGIQVEGHERMWQKHQPPKVISDLILSNWIFANSVHTIDLLRFFGGEVKKVCSISRSHIEQNGDQFAATIEFESGVIGQYISYWYSPGGWKVTLFGDGVTVEFNPLEKGVWIDRNCKRHEILPDDEDVRFKPGFYKQIEAFGKMIKDNKKTWPLQNLADSNKTMQLIDWIKSGVCNNEVMRICNGD